MKRRIIKENKPVRTRKNNNIVFGRVTKDGRPVPAPRPTYDNITLPSANMPFGGEGITGINAMYNKFDLMNGINPDYELMETLDDYNALHYYGLDGLKNIDF